MYLDDLERNSTFTTKPVRIDREKMIAFSLEYDPFPIHHDEAAAEKFRFGRLIAPGYLSFVTVWSEMISSKVFTDGLIAGKQAKIEWLRPVYPDDVLTGRGRISRIERRNRHNGIAEVTLEIYNQNEELVMKNVTEAIVAYRPEQQEEER